MKPAALFLIDPPRMDQVYGPDARKRIEEFLTMIAPPQSNTDYADLGARLKEVRVLLSSWGMPRMTAEFLAHFPQLEMVFFGAGSVREIVTDASWARGVRIASASSSNAIPTAEFSFAAIVMCLKQAWRHAAAISRSGRYCRDTSLMAGTYRSTVGLLALGRIGRLVAARLQSLSVSVIAYDPMVTPDEAAALGVKLCSLDDVFNHADVVSCHLPLLPQTVGKLGATHFRAMKVGASFINTSRGAVVVEGDLEAVLRERPDLFALLDVTSPEPPVEGSPLFTLPNLVLTPHIAGSAGPECRRLGDTIADEVERYVRGEFLANEITQGQATILA